jgi:hypothetical protein
MQSNFNNWLLLPKRLGKCSVGRPQARRSDDLCRTAGRSWTSSQRSSEMARNWRGLCPAVDCSGFGDDDDDGYHRLVYPVVNLHNTQYHRDNIVE